MCDREKGTATSKAERERYGRVPYGLCGCLNHSHVRNGRRQLEPVDALWDRDWGGTRWPVNYMAPEVSGWAGVVPVCVTAHHRASCDRVASFGLCFLFFLVGVPHNKR